MILRPLLLTVAFTLGAQAAEPVIAYSKGAIYSARLDGSERKKLTTGAWPDVSPDGTKVVYNTESSDKPERHIAVVEIATGKKTIFKDIPSDNCHSPRWSPDGKQISFYIFTDSDWHIGLINADGTGFRYVRKSAGHNTFWGAAWATDGKSLFCQDLNTLYRIDLHGKILEQWNLTDVFGEAAGMNSGSVLAPAPDGRTLLVDVDMAEDVERPGWDGPPPALWRMDLATGKAKAVTKAAQFVWNPAWIDENSLLCRHMPGGLKTMAIYRLDLPTGKLTLVVPGATDASVSRERRSP